MLLFGDFRLDVRGAALWRREQNGLDRPTLLPPRAFALLTYLVERNGRMVTHSELLDAVWQRSYVQPEVLKTQILALRTALGDDAKTPRYIETVPRRGYRFVAPVATVVAEDDSPGLNRLVGRNAALSALDAAFDCMLGGERRLVFVTGEPGMGKTALLDAFRARVAARNSAVRIGAGQCVEGYGGQESYAPLIEALDEIGRERASVVEILSRVAPTWLRHMPELGKGTAARAVRDDTHVSQNRMGHELAEALRAIAGGGPVLLLLDDVQWADGSTIDALASFARQREPARVMVVAGARPGDIALGNAPLAALRRELTTHSLCLGIDLEPLTLAALNEWLAQQACTAALPASLMSMLHERSAGNPLLLHTALRRFDEEGWLRATPDGWRLSLSVESLRTHFPDSVRELTEARILQLSVQVQEMLEVASVIGLEFVAAGVAAGCGRDIAAIETDLELLSGARLLIRRHSSVGPPGASISQGYAFRHGLFRQALYDRQSAGRRALRHGKVGGWLERASASDPAASAFELAYHFEAAGEWSAAVRYMQLAAERVVRHYGYREGLGLLFSALRIARKLLPPEGLEIEMTLTERTAQLQAACFDVESIHTYRDLAAKAVRAGDVYTEVRALVGMAYPVGWLNPAEATELCRGALKLAERLDDPVQRCRARLSARSWAVWRGGWDAEAVELCYADFEMLERNADRPTLAWHAMEVSGLKILSAEYGVGIRLADFAIDVLARSGQPVDTVQLARTFYLHLVPWALTLKGDWGRAASLLESSIELMFRNGEHRLGHKLNLTKAWLHAQAKDWSTVASICDSASAFFNADGRGGHRAEARVLGTLRGVAATDRGDLRTAESHLLAADEGLPAGALAHNLYWRMVLLQGIVKLRIAQGDIAAARSASDIFLQAASNTGERTWQALAWEAAGRVDTAEARWAEALLCVERAWTLMGKLETSAARLSLQALGTLAAAELPDAPRSAWWRNGCRETVSRLAASLAPEHTLCRSLLAAPEIVQAIG